MKFSVDAHAIGRRLTGNEVYVRNLLSSFASLDKDSEFITYLSVDEPSPWVPARFAVRRVSPNPFVRLGFDLSSKLRRDRPDLRRTNGLGDTRRTAKRDRKSTRLNSSH